MGHILNAALAIVLGVGVLVLYFYGSNRLLDWLLPNYDEENPPQLVAKRFAETVKVLRHDCTGIPPGTIK